MDLEKIRTIEANPGNYGGSRRLDQIQYIIIHYTSNDGDTAYNNCMYFKNTIVKASAHYFVDGNMVYRSVKDNTIAWSVGGNKYPSCPQTGGGKFFGKCTNTSSVSIEICDTKKDGRVYPTQQAIKQAQELTEALMAKYNIPKDRVIRHFDVTGKLCPAYWCGDSNKDQKWLTEFKNGLKDNPNDIYKKIVKEKAGLSDNTIRYLMRYEYGTDLIRKLAEAMK